MDYNIESLLLENQRLQDEIYELNEAKEKKR